MKLIPIHNHTTEPGLQNFKPNEEMDAALNVSTNNVLLGRVASGEGPHEEINPAALTEETAPAAGDYLPIWTGDGLRKVDFGEFGGGGGGGGSVATDTIWDAKGDIAAATGADAAVKVSVGNNGTVLSADSAESAGVKWAKPWVRNINAQTGTAYSLVFADEGKVVTLSNASAITLTVPPNGSVAFDIGTIIDLIQTGAGQVTVAQGSGVTVNATPGLKFRAQHSGATLLKTDTNTWQINGDLAA